MSDPSSPAAPGAGPHDDRLFRALIENVSDVAAILDAEGVIRYASPSAERVLGYRTEALLGRRVFDLVHPEDVPAALATLRRRLSDPGTEQITRHRMRHADGSWRMMEGTGSNRLDDPVVRGIVVTLRDVTRRLDSENALRESSETLRALVSAAPAAVVGLDTGGCVTLWNPAAQRIFGWSEAEVLGRPLPHIPEAERREHERLRDRVLAGEAFSDVEVVRRRRNGSLVPVRLSAAPLRGPDGEVTGVVSISVDVSDQKRSAEALVRKDEYFRTLTENSTDLVTILSTEGTVLYKSPSIRRILGYDPAELLGTDVLNMVHPDDAPRVQATLEAVRREPDVLHSAVYRYRHRGGEWRVLESAAKALMHGTAMAGLVVNSRDVTERAEAEKLNRELAAIVRSSGDAILSKSLADGTILSWNPGAEQIFGFSAEEAVGRPISIIYPAEREMEEIQIRLRLARGEVLQNYETIRCRKDGKQIDVSLSVAPIPDETGRIYAASVIARDITVQRAAEQALAESRAELRALVTAMSDVILVIDREGRYVDTPSTSAPLLFRPPQELIGRRMHDHFSTRQADFFLRSVHHALETGRPTRIEYSLPFDGRDIWFSASISPMSEERVVWVARDITELKEAERALRAAKEAAEAASRAKSEFLSSMSHELRTPLNSVIGFANVLRKNKEGNLRPQDRAYLDRILANGRHLLGLINDLLDLSKIEAGKMEVERAPVELRGLLEETLAELQPQARSGVQLRVEMPEQVEVVETDARRLKQLLINLVGNALKFTDRGSVTVRVLTDRRSHRPLRLEVIDTGIGIAPDRLNAIFHAFEQGETGTSRRFGGTGLGLAISSSLARLLGCRIEVQSRPGEGSTFSVLLPPPADTTATDALQREPGSERGEFRGKRVLVIDDERDARTMLTEALSELGCEVLAASSGERGLRAAREHRPDLITLDLVMPDLGGWEVLQALKADPDLAEIPVVIVSVLADADAGALLGAVDLLSKPLERDALRQVLRRSLRRLPARVLVVDGDEEVRRMVVSCMGRADVEVRCASSAADTLRLARALSPELIFLGLPLPDGDGVGVLARLRAELPHLNPRVVLMVAEDEPALVPAGEAPARPPLTVRKGTNLEEELRRVARDVLEG